MVINDCYVRRFRSWNLAVALPCYVLATGIEKTGRFSLTRQEEAALTGTYYSAELNKAFGIIAVKRKLALKSTIRLISKRTAQRFIRSRTRWSFIFPVAGSSWMSAMSFGDLPLSRSNDKQLIK